MHCYQYASIINKCHNLQLSGTPSEAELEFLNENAKKYIRQLPPYRRQSFTEKFPQVHPAAIDLVEKMLTFDPRRRLTGEFFKPPPNVFSLILRFIIHIAGVCNSCIYHQV